MKTAEEKKIQIIELFDASESSLQDMEDNITKLSGMEEYLMYANVYLEFTPRIGVTSQNLHLEDAICTNVQYEEAKKCLIFTVVDAYMETLKLHVKVSPNTVFYYERICWDTQMMELELENDFLNLYLYVFRETPHPET